MNQLKESPNMGMMEAVKSVFNNYANFTGRARRSEYWYWQLFNFLVIMVLYIPVFALVANESEAVVVPGILVLLYVLATIVPSLAVIVRRLHDTGRSGWYYFMGFIPLVGSIIVLIYCVEDSKPGPNQWGPNPKGIGNTHFNDHDDSFEKGRL